MPSPPPEPGPLADGTGASADGGRVSVGRFAPSPTGDLHLGSALAALGAWAHARSRGGRFVWRVEDLDGPRAVPGAAGRQLEDARWLGLDWDEGPDVGGPHGPYRQSGRAAVYDAALGRLARAGRLFPCRVSRADLREVASAPHGPLPPYPAALRPADLPPDWFDDPAARADAALRFRVAPGAVTWDDGVLGAQRQDVAAEVGDVVLRRRDGVTAYQLAVVVDDLAMGVTEVVRGQDLVDSTARQVQIIEALGGAVPTYAHLPLVVGPDREKLSKSDGSLTVRALRRSGVASRALVGWLAETLGQGNRGPLAPAEVAATFDLGRVPPGPVVVPDDLVSRLRS